MLAVALFAGDIYVSPKGSDANPGTKALPKATLAAALRQAREWRRLNDTAIKGGIHIMMQGGIYPLYEPVFIRPEDSGTADSPTTIEAEGTDQPVLSGGINITNWRKAGKVAGLPSTAAGHVYEADVPLNGGRPFEFRQLWVNGTKAIRARDRNGDSMNRILAWNKKTGIARIPAKGLSALADAPALEMVMHQWWAIAILRVKQFEWLGDSAQLHFHEPERTIQAQHPWPAPWLSQKTGNSAFYLVNAIQLLDMPGEWYLDIAKQKVYYWPRTGEDLRTATVVAPQQETLVRIEGTIDHPVQYVQFKSISFQHTGWLRPSQQGHVPLQAGLFLLDAYHLEKPGTPDKKGLENQGWTGRPSAAVQVKYAAYTRFEACRFEHLASTGIDYVRGTHDDVIAGNLFKEIGGTAILAGVFSDEAVEAHLPYNPADERDICTNEQIHNNLVTDVTNEDWGCVGIGAGFVRGMNIAHNEIADVAYTGISLGWGWTKTINAMRNNTVQGNKIVRYARWMYDVASIYTLSAQPGTVISGNYADSICVAPYAHLPEHWFYLYTDEGSAYMTVKDNWCPAEKFLQNANGPNNVWTNNGPMVKDSIQQAAGLLPAYQYLLHYKSHAYDHWPINHYTPDDAEKKH